MFHFSFCRSSSLITCETFCKKYLKIFLSTPVKTVERTVNERKTTCPKQSKKDFSFFPLLFFPQHSYYPQFTNTLFCSAVVSGFLSLSAHTQVWEQTHTHIYIPPAATTRAEADKQKPNRYYRQYYQQKQFATYIYSVPCLLSVNALDMQMSVQFAVFSYYLLREDAICHKFYKII